MLVKICGITRASDADAAVEAGARALGFVFWPSSPRFIDPYRAREIVKRLPPFVTPVGVFVNQTSAHVNAVAALVGLGVAQLHGDETPDHLAALRVPVIKAVGLVPDDAASGIGASEDVAAIWPDRVTLLLDVHDPVRRGGTGRVVDWSVAAALSARRRIVLAGGLTPENVAAAVRRVRPFGIDVSSGVEQSPGVKDRARIKALFDAVGEAMSEASREGARVL